MIIIHISLVKTLIHYFLSIEEEKYGIIIYGYFSIL